MTFISEVRQNFGNFETLVLEILLLPSLAKKILGYFVQEAREPFEGLQY